MLLGFSEFLRFVTSQEECRIKWHDAQRQIQKYKKLLDEAKKENINLERNLMNARKLLDKERRKKLQSEEERLQIVSVQYS